MSNFNLKIELDNRQKALLELEGVKEAILLALGEQARKNADVEITKVIYDTPQSPNYKRTGRLRASLSYSTKKHTSKVKKPAKSSDGLKRKDVPDKDTVSIGTNVSYAVYNELGTSKMSARPFLKPAIENNKEDYKKIVENSLKGK